MTHGSARKALLVPRQAVLIDGQGQYVIMRKSDGTFERRKIREGSRSGDNVEVVEGLQAGDRIVTAGNILVVPH